MTAEKRNFEKQPQKQTPQPLLESFSVLFYICKLLGVNSQDWNEFKKYKQLKRSPGGESFVITIMVLVFINFNLMIGIFESITYIEEKNNLSVVIGFFLTYFSLVIYFSDRIMALRQQQNLEDIFHDFDELDEDFAELNIVFNNNHIKKRTIAFIVYAVLIESLIFISTFMLLVDNNNWTAWLWIFTAIPTFFNTLDKVWFNGILLAISTRFEAINRAFDTMALKMEAECNKENNFKWPQSMEKKPIFKNKIQPVSSINSHIFGDEITNPQIFSISQNLNNSSETTYSDWEERCTKLCQLHDGLCNVGKLMNRVWAFPNFMLMGYGFYIITAQLYFLYCSHSQQSIPSLFRPAQNWAITAIYLLYISSKCISILLLSWQTNLECKKTGICIHRCALAADKNEIYEMINHLSLKLFNHLFDFNACGYFPLNMTTLFSFCGGITTYLIILIQFNMEGQQVSKTSGVKVIETNGTLVGNTTYATIYGNSTSLLYVLYHYWSGSSKKLY